MSEALRRLAYLCLEAPREGHATYAHVHEIIAGLERRGWEVELWASHRHDKWERPGAAMRLFEYLRLQMALAVRMGRYDALYLRAHPLAFPAALAARWRKVPVVHECNGTYADLYVAHPSVRFARRVLDGMQRLQYRWGRGLIGVTPQLAEFLRREAAPAMPEIAVIPNGANTDLFHPDAVCDDPFADKLPEKYVVFFGGLTRWHGVPDMLAALAAPHWPENIALVVVGDGPEAPKLKQAAAQDERLVLLGRQPYTSIPGIVARALAGLVPISDPDGRSSSSGLAPLKLYETLACGIPAIVSDFPGQADLVRAHKCGLCYPSGDGAALAQAVAALAGDAGTRNAMGQRGAEATRRLHSWDSRAADTDAVLAKACASTPTPELSML